MLTCLFDVSNVDLDDTVGGPFLDGLQVFSQLVLDSICVISLNLRITCCETKPFMLNLKRINEIMDKNSSLFVKLYCKLKRL